MDILNDILYIIFFGSFFLYIIEMICMWLLFPALGHLGIKINSTKGLPLFIDRLEIGKQYATDHAKFIRVSNNSCMFRCRNSFFKLFAYSGEIAH